MSGPPTSPPGRGIPLPAVLGVAVLVGIPLGLAALLFVWVEDSLQGWLWTDLPEALGMGSSPEWWWVLIVPAFGGLVVALAYRLPGRGGHNPALGFNATPTQPRELPGAMVAAIATLSCGAVLGPEAPLIALGSAIGLLLARAVRAAARPGPALGHHGSFGAIAAVFGNPLNTSVFMLEAGGGRRGRRRADPRPAARVRGRGDGIPHLHRRRRLGRSTDARTPDPGPGDVRLGQLVAPGRRGRHRRRRGRAHRGDPRGCAAPRPRRRASLSPYLVLPSVGLLIGLCAVAFETSTGRPYDLVLFSGQDGLDALAAETSAGVVAVLLLAKGLAYLVSLGGGFRGGPVFPAMFLGTAVGILASLILPDLPVTAAVAIGIAAGMAGMLGFVIAAVLFALLVTGEAGFEATSLAILAAAAAWVVRAGLDKALSGRHSNVP